MSIQILDRTLPASPPRAGSELTLFRDDGQPIGTQAVPPGFMAYPGLKILFGDEYWEVQPGGVQVIFPSSGPAEMLIEVRVTASRGIHDAADFPDDRHRP